MEEVNTMKIVIPYLPKSLNKIIRMKRILIRLYYRECKHYIQWLIKSKKRKPDKPYKKAKIFITFTFPDNKARDLDNYIGGCKGFIDGIKKEGIIEDDSWQKLRVGFKGERGKKAMTTIDIEEIK